MNPSLYPIPFLAVFVFFLIRAQLLKKQRQVYVFKPISTLLVIGVLCLAFLDPDHNLNHTLGILVGLVFRWGKHFQNRDGNALEIKSCISIIV